MEFWFSLGSTLAGIAFAGVGILLRLKHVEVDAKAARDDAKASREMLDAMHRRLDASGFPTYVDKSQSAKKTPPGGTSALPRVGDIVSTDVKKENT